MDLITWTDAFDVGVEEINQQHQKLIALMNQLNAAQRSGQTSDVIFGILNELVDYVRIHFTAEEAMLEREGYPKLQEHMLHHYGLMKQVLEYNARFWRAEEGLSSEVLDFLKDWLTHHILNEDLRYTAYLQAPAAPSHRKSKRKAPKKR